MDRSRILSEKQAEKCFRELYFLLKNCRFHLMAPYINGFVVLFGFLTASDPVDFFSVETALVYLFSVFHTGAIYSLNNVYDVESDEKQLATAGDFGRWNLSVKNQLALGNTTRRKASLFSLILFTLSTLFFYLEGGLLPSLFSVMIFVWGWAYSAPPVKLKNRLFLDLILHGIFWGSFLFLMGSTMRNIGSLSSVMPCLILVYFASIMWEFHNHFEDYPADKEAGSLTFVVRFGLRRSFYVYLLSIGGAIAYSILLLPAMESATAFLVAMTIYLMSSLKVAKETSFETLFLPRKHFYLANLFLLLWIGMSLYFR